jgi:RNA polymerase sigma factor (sigma-70 family)
MKSKTTYTTHEEDKELVVSALAGNQRSYNVLLGKYKPVLYTAAKRRLPYAIPEDLEDIVMIVLGNAFVKINQYDPEKSKFFTWMVACLHNYINSIPKQKKRVQQKSYDDDEYVAQTIFIPATFDEDIDRAQSNELIRVLLKKLPKDYGKALYLQFFKGYSHDEIAEALCCDKGLVWYKIQRGKELLKRLSEQHELFEND